MAAENPDGSAEDALYAALDETAGQLLDEFRARQTPQPIPDALPSAA